MNRSIIIKIFNNSERSINLCREVFLFKVHNFWLDFISLTEYFLSFRRSESSTNYCRLNAFDIVDFFSIKPYNLNERIFLELNRINNGDGEECVQSNNNNAIEIAIFKYKLEHSNIEWELLHHPDASERSRIVAILLWVYLARRRRMDSLRRGLSEWDVFVTRIRERFCSLLMSSP